MPPLNQQRVDYLASFGITMTEIKPMGARVEGLDLREVEPPSEVIKILQDEMSERGFIVFGGQGVMTGDQ